MVTALIAVQTAAAAVEPVWKGTVTTDASQKQATYALNQHTVYTLSGASSTFTSTISEHSDTTTLPCGTYRDSYTGVGEGPYETLRFQIELQHDASYAAGLSTDTNQYHSGTQVDRECALVNGNYQVVSSEYERQNLVYPPISALGCADTLFAVPPGIQAIRGTVTKTCGADGVESSSTWTYAVKLEPCNPAIDSDAGGLGDCAEFDRGSNPQDPADDLTVIDDPCADNSPPEAALVGEPVDWRGDTPDMRFASESSDLDGDVLSTAWTFTDTNGTATATGPTADVAWNAAGFTATSPPRVATLTVTDPCGARDSASIAFRVTGDPMVDFAPIAHLHPREDYWPMSPKKFLAKSSLKYAIPNRRDKTVHPNPSSAKLGAGAYPIKDNGLRLSSDDFTRPYADGKAPKCPTCGYYLDLPTKYQKGDKPSGRVIGTDMIVQPVKDYVVYWMFYGLSQATTYGGVPTKGIKHQGDWERVVVDLNATTLVPQRVGYVAHHDPVHWVPFKPMRSSSATLSDAFALNPQAYVSRLGHGTWHGVGVFKTCKLLVACAYDHTSAGGYLWDGAVNQTSINNQSWFGSASDHKKCRKGAPMPKSSLACGFGGAWGHSGSSGDQTGPAGPSAYKTATEN